MNTCTRLLVAGMAVWALSSGPAWGDIVNGDFSTGDQAGWDALALPMDDPSLALVEIVGEQLHMRVENNYVFDSLDWQLQEGEAPSFAQVSQDVILHGGAPLGTTGLQFDWNVQILGNPTDTDNIGAQARVVVNYSGKDYSQSDYWVTTVSSAGTHIIELPDLNVTGPELDVYLYTFSGLDPLPPPVDLDPTTYNIVVKATFDNFQFVTGEVEPAIVPIDIRPGVSPNTINLGSNGVIPVAICSTEDFDALQIDPLTVTLADAGVRVRGKGKSIFATEDVNGDGLIDMILKIETEGLTLSPDATEALLTGMTYDGVAFEGVGQVSIVPGRNALPEPSSIVLLILGGMGVLRRRRLRGNSRN